MNEKFSFSSSLPATGSKPKKAKKRQNEQSLENTKTKEKEKESPTTSKESLVDLDSSLFADDVDEDDSFQETIVVEDPEVEIVDSIIQSTNSTSTDVAIPDKKDLVGNPESDEDPLPLPEPIASREILRQQINEMWRDMVYLRSIRDQKQLNDTRKTFLMALKEFEQGFDKYNAMRAAKQQQEKAAQKINALVDVIYTWNCNHCGSKLRESFEELVG